MEKAFEVFMAKGYDSVSMTVLQKKLEMSRGAMYRYFESKEDLFKAVVDKHLFGLIDFIRPSFSNDITVKIRIEQSYQALKKAGSYFDKIEGIEVVFLNYTAFIIQAAKHYPGFLDKMKKRKESELKSWRQAIENSINEGEISNDVDIKIMAQVFSKAVDFSDPDKPGKNFSKASENSKKMMDYIYSLIKT